MILLDPTTSANDNNSSKDTFYDYLTSEIEYLKGELERPGWTRWAIIASIAYLIWLLLDILEYYTPNIQSLSITLISFLALHQIYFFVKLQLTSDTGNHNDKIIPTNVLLGDNRFYILILFLLAIIILFLTYHLPDTLCKWSTIAIKAYIIIFSLFLIFFFISSFLYLPLARIPTPKPSSGIIYFVIFLIPAFFLYDSINYYIHYPDIIHLDDIKFTGLILALAYLFLLLIKTPIHSRMLENLITIRRDLILNKLELSDAIRQTSIVLTGIKASGYIQTYVHKYLDISHKIEVIIDRFILDARELKSWIRDVEERGINNFSPDDKNNFKISFKKYKDIYATSLKYKRELHTYFDELTKIISTIRNHLKVIVGVYNLNDKDIDNLLINMDESNAILHEKINSEGKELTDIENSIDAIFSTINKEDKKSIT
jgi:hypothetical protein